MQDLKLSRELGLRLASASVLIPLALLCVWLGGVAIALIASACAVLMAFEWARMAEARTAPAMMAGAGLANMLMLADARWALLTLVGAGAAAMLLEPRKELPRTILLGTLYCGGLPLALQAIRANPDAGLALAMGVMLLSWSSDSAAYFVGRRFRGPLLAPRDSPNKTWSGAIGAVVGSGLAGMAYALLIGGSPVIWALVGVAVSLAAQVGDLFESQVKRQHGVKDTSGFLPGHGGVMDRLDGFGTACVVFWAATRLMPWLPPHLAGA